MYRNIRLILVFILIALFFAPLGSCAVKTNRDGNSIKISRHAISELSRKELHDAKIESFKIYQAKIRGLDIPGSGGILYLLSLIGTFAISNMKKVSGFVKFANVLLVITFALSYIAFASFAFAAPTTTIYGWTFILVGVLYVWSCMPRLVPKRLINA